MASSKKEEKEKFFADLYHLDELDDEQEQPSHNAHVEGTVGPRQAPPQASRKRKSWQMTSATAALTTSTSSPATFEPTSSLIRQVALPKPHCLRRSISDHHPQTSAKSLRKGKREEVVPETKRIFTGLVFFFVPNNDKAPVRRLRIQKAIAYGATWAQTWQDSVTHIIVDGGLHIEAASKEFHERKIPVGVPIVTDRWLTESLGYKDLRDVAGTRFRISGMTAVCFNHDEKETTDKDNAAATKIRPTDQVCNAAEGLDTHVEARTTGMKPDRIRTNPQPKYATRTAEAD